MKHSAWLFCNIGWMERYEGVTHTDKIIGGGRYVQVNEFGHEVCNFRRVNGCVYGFVQARNHTLNLKRLGAEGEPEFLKGVTVVWTARKPEMGTVVVGWYRNATVFRTMRPFDGVSPTEQWQDLEGFYVTADEKDAVLLRPDLRTLRVPRGRHGMGQSNVWYAEQGAPEFMRAVESLIARGRPQSTRSKAAPRSFDKLRRLKVERVAVEVVWQHYEAMKFELESVEADNLGWDLEAKLGPDVLRIEVKGLSGSVPCVDLTTNEYDVFCRRKLDYRLCVVTDCLATPRLHVFRYNLPSQSWVSEENGPQLVLDIEERVSARAVGRMLTD